MFSKITVLGPERHPLYDALAGDQDVRWNFEKFLISRTGEVVGRFAPTVTPGDDELVTAIEQQLAAPQL